MFSFLTCQQKTYIHIIISVLFKCISLQAAQWWTLCCLKKLFHVCEPRKQGRIAHRSCHFKTPRHTCHNIHPVLWNAYPLTFKTQTQTGRQRRERPHGIIFMVQKKSRLLFFPPSYHELRQYHLVTQRAVMLRDSETRNVSGEQLLYDSILR